MLYIKTRFDNISIKEAMPVHTNSFIDGKALLQILIAGLRRKGGIRCLRATPEDILQSGHQVCVVSQIKNFQVL